MAKTVSTHHALIYVMVTIAAVEGHLGDRELKAIGSIVKQLPIFRSFDSDKLTHVAQECGEILQDKEPKKSESVMAALLQMKKLDIAGLKRVYEQP